MANSFQVTIDSAGPRALGAFWCEVLGYIEQPPPPGFDTWEEALDSYGVDRSDPDRAFAIVDRDLLVVVSDAHRGRNGAFRRRIAWRPEHPEQPVQHRICPRSRR